MDLIAETLLHHSSRYELCIIVLYEAIEKGITLSPVITFARLTALRDALKLEKNNSSSNDHI